MSDASTDGWTGQRERGSALLLRLMLWLTMRLGWTVGHALLLPITAWFLATSGNARAASRDYLSRVLGRPVRALDVARHFHSFACATLDRAFIVTGRIDRFSIETSGLEHVTRVLDQGTGCVLLGAHLGSFEVLRSIGQQSPVPVHPLMFRANAGPLTRLIERLDPSLRASAIEIGDAASMLRVRESVERGEIVGILGDRAPGGHKLVSAPFLGSPAAFPAGPFILAATLGVPVVLFYGVRLGPRRYAVRFQPFAEQVTLHRARRAADLQAWVTRYAAALEEACRAHPFNWFNFFLFWRGADDVRGSSPRPARPDVVGREEAMGAVVGRDGAGAVRTLPRAARSA